LSSRPNYPNVSRVWRSIIPTSLVRGGGNQAFHTGCVWLVNSVLIAVLARYSTGRGQLVDVSMHAAANVTTEAASVRWLVSRETVQRQTGRHAWPVPTQPKQYRTCEGGYVNISVPPRTGAGCRVILEWVESLGLRARVDDVVFLEIGSGLDYIPLPEQTDDVEIKAVGGAMAEALQVIAASLTAVEFSRGAQERGITGIAIVSPEELIDDEHFQAREFHVTQYHDGIGQEVIYPGAPFKMSRSPWQLRGRAPRLGEHNQVLDR
jgi:crotonobetainyl-CoA:carnitine CoA-transferase CaiB-like acyl-CoA transferase